MQTAQDSAASTLPGVRFALGRVFTGFGLTQDDDNPLDGLEEIGRIEREYDNEGRLSAEGTWERGELFALRTLEHGPGGMLIEEKLVHPGMNSSQTESFVYDAAGQLKQSTLVTNDGHTQVTTLTTLLDGTTETRITDSEDGLIELSYHTIDAAGTTEIYRWEIGGDGDLEQTVYYDDHARPIKSIVTDRNGSMRVHYEYRYLEGEQMLEELRYDERGVPFDDDSQTVLCVWKREETRVAIERFDASGNLLTREIEASQRYGTKFTLGGSIIELAFRYDGDGRLREERRFGAEGD